MKTLRNADLKETSLSVDGRPVLRFAQVSFRRHACQPGMLILYLKDHMLVAHAKAVDLL